jgi:gliding motility-associated-like protein
MTSYTWNNGANPATTSVGVVPPAIISPTFVYSAPGTYTPFLAFNTAGGCSAISYVDTITVVNQPTVGPISVATMSACVGTPVTVSMTAAPNASLMQHWHVQSDQGFFSGCVSNSVSTWFFTHPGVQGFTVSAYQHSCKSETVAPQTILIRGPVAKVRFQTNCTNKKSVDFSTFLQEVATATLNYGDNTADIITGNPTGIVSDLRTHIYTSTGDKTVTLRAANPGSGCSYSQTVIVKVREINADFTILNPVLCKGDPLSLNASASTDVYSTCARGYAWLMDNEPTVQTFSAITNYGPDSPLSPLFISGQHTIALWVKDVNSCSSSVVKTFTVGSPTANFTFPSPVCISEMPVHFTNTSPQSPIAATNFTWSFGTAAATLANVFSDPAPMFNYTAAIPGQSYTISLLTTGQYTQCTDVITKTLQVVNPFTPELYPYEAGPCINASTAFNVVNGGFTYSVNFGDGSPIFVSTQTTIAHTFTTPGVYTPTISIGSGTCVNSVLSNMALTVPPTPTAGFISYYTNPSSTLAPVPVGSIQCSPANLTFSSTSTPASNLVYNWSIQGLGPTVQTPTILTSWATLGIYTVTLRVHPNGSEKCPGVITKTFSVISPTAQIVVDRNRICLGETVKASLKDTNNILGWVWVVAGSSNTVLANSMPSPSVSYVFANSGDNKINIRYFGPGYFCPGNSEVNVNVVLINANFKRNAELTVGDSAHCLSISDFFENRSLINNSPVGDGLNYSWNFGNGITSSSLSPIYTYPSPGFYTVTLLVTEPSLQCKSTAVKHMTIYPIPSANVSAIDSVCRGSSFQLSSNTSSDVIQYQWLPLIGLSNPNASVTPVIAQTSASYSLVVTNNFGCETTSRGEYVYVQQPPPSYKWDTTVVIGEPINLNSQLGTNYTYTWTPPDALSCINCLFPISTSTIDITYTLQVQDQLACFRVFNPYTIYIDPKTSIDVPSAFTPNGDGTNDVIYVDGWGIKKLNYFRIFNRWGQLIFESNDIKVGWDGNYNGVPQNMETYVYQVSVETYIPDKSLQKSSNFKLIR